MSHDDAFLEAILDAPDDDAPRLLYADWLDEHGNADRAEFIRVQCAAERLPQADPRRRPLMERARVLLRARQREWDRPLLDAAGCRPPSRRWMAWLLDLPRPKRTYPPLYDWTYRRGFIDSIDVAMRAFLDRADAFFRTAPLREVVFESGAAASVDALVAMPHLRRLRRLELSGLEIDDLAARTLARCPHLSGLSALVLYGNNIGEMGAHELAASPHLAGLTVLDLGWNLIGPGGARALAASPHLSRLTVLNLQECGVESAVRAALRARFPAARILF